MIIGVTGHRKITTPKIILEPIVEQLFQELNPDLVITGMALGFDQFIAAKCIKSNIKFLAAIPCDNQDKFWTEKQKEFYKVLLGKASEIIVVSPGEYAAWKMFKRNEFILNNCETLVCYLDPSIMKGGTYDTVTKAKKHYKKIINVFA